MDTLTGNGIFDVFEHESKRGQKKDKNQMDGWLDRTLIELESERENRKNN